MAEEDARETVRWTLGVVNDSAPCFVKQVKEVSKRSSAYPRETTHVSEQLDAFFDTVNATSLKQLLHGDGLGRIDQTEVDPML